MIKNSKKIISAPLTIFTVSLIIFIISAALGWEKLHYGFNYTDEGYIFTEAWRITVGDQLFQDELRGAIDLSPIINSLLFRISPDITLLGFRKLQFVITIFALLLFSATLYRINKQYWYQPLIFSVFAFTGANPTGLLPNLNYDTYPHLFMIFHLTFLLMGFYQESEALRRLLFMVSGFCLWLISFSLLHCSIVIILPLFYFYTLHKWRVGNFSFAFKDLIFMLLPIILCWAFFIALFNVVYIRSVISSIQTMMATQSHSLNVLFHINWQYLESVIISLFFLAMFFYCLSKFNIFFLLFLL